MASIKVISQRKNAVQSNNGINGTSTNVDGKNIANYKFNNIDAQRMANRYYKRCAEGL